MSTHLPEEQRALDLLGRVGHGRVATSMHALPLLAVARHIVTEDGRVLLRMHRGPGYHEAIAGAVIAYGADNLGAHTLGARALAPGNPGAHTLCPGGPGGPGGPGARALCPGSPGGGDPVGGLPDDLWAVQLIGVCAMVEPDSAEVRGFGPAPVTVDGERYDPVFLRVQPQFATVHSLDHGYRAVG
ncbi:pyridoxamine 5'-phosphate oxidase family protein [Streptomyces tsukubensis]|uniref:pyridoxamine 5'-phosphate oxidase family protein n=1 Tax=Streptomyces tsukubensis TaxID=83656 RepID=UPI001D05B289|nr:pyridoxamine 5'-phosphate oxidase family protein [Streptomyces tsukubensis]